MDNVSKLIQKKEKNQIVVGNLYDLNKQAYSMMKLPTQQKINKYLSDLGGWLSSNYKCTYYILLCREKYDFTIFRVLNQSYYETTQEIKGVLESRGDILEVRYSHEFDYYECWIKDRNTDEPIMYAFFPCDDWIIEIE